MLMHDAVNQRVLAGIVIAANYSEHGYRFVLGV
jgi:hypothetical protein